MGKCVQAKGNDPVNFWLEKAFEADGIILASPTHFANVSVTMKSFIDRVGWNAIAKKFLANKVGAGVVAAAGDGSTGCLDAVC